MSLDKKFQKLERELNRVERMGEKEIAENYKVLFNDLKKTISEIYEKYERDGELTYDEMVKYDRLQKLEKQVQDMVNNTYKANSKAIRGTLEGIAKDTYINSIGIVNEIAKTKIRGIVKDLPVAEIVNEDMKGLHWIERMGKHRADAIWDIQKEIKQGLRDGDTYSTMTRRLRKRVESDRDHRIRTIVRTEAHKVKAAAKEQSFDRIEKSGVKFKEQWISSQDERVRSSHQEMDGVTVDRGEGFTLPGGYKCFGPGDPSLPASEVINCRCIKILVLDETVEEAKPEKYITDKSKCGKRKA